MYRHLGAEIRRLIPARRIVKEFICRQCHLLRQNNKIEMKMTLIMGFPLVFPKKRVLKEEKLVHQQLTKNLLLKISFIKQTKEVEV